MSRSPGCLRVPVVRLRIVRSIDSPRPDDVERWIRYRQGRCGWNSQRWTIYVAGLEEYRQSQNLTTVASKSTDLVEEECGS